MSKINLTELTTEIDTTLTLLRQKIIELRQVLGQESNGLADQDGRLVELQTENENSKTQIYSDAPAPEFIPILEDEIEKVRSEIAEVRRVVTSLGEFSEKFEDQLLALIELDKKMTEALMAYKF